MHSKAAATKKAAVLMTMFLAAGLTIAEPAHAADFFDRIAVINSKLPVLKTFMIYIAFLIGIGALIWGGTEMLKLSKPDTRGEATWLGVGVKMLGGAVLVGLTLSSDLVQNTFFGNSSSGANLSYFEQTVSKRV